MEFAGRITAGTMQIIVLFIDRMEESFAGFLQDLFNFEYMNKVCLSVLIVLILIEVGGFSGQSSFARRR